MRRVTIWVQTGAARTFLVVVIALLTASAASFGVYRAVQQIPVREVEVASVHVVVAATRLPVGTLVSADQVRLAPWPARNQVPGAFSSIDDVINRGVIQAMSENEPLTDNKLAPREAGAGLPPMITPGMRAISVKVNEVVGVAGFVVPGSHVDILVTLDEHGSGQGGLSRIVVSNVQVLTAGTRYDQEKALADGKPIPTTVVTLLATPADAERITLAAAEGQLMLTLRNPLDTLPTNTKGVRLSNLTAAPAPPPVARRVQGKTVMVAAPPPAPKIYTVEAIRAAERSEEVVR